jgi:hypothetical protein
MDWIQRGCRGISGMSPFATTREMLMISEYSLPGSYRKIIHLPKTFTWSHVSYTDPDISLVQSDEDKILGENPAAEDDPEGMSCPFLLISFLSSTYPSSLSPSSIRVFSSSFPPLHWNSHIIGREKADIQANSKHSKSNSPSVPQHTQQWPCGKSQGKRPLHGIRSA